MMMMITFENSKHKKKKTDSEFYSCWKDFFCYYCCRRYKFQKPYNPHYDIVEYSIVNDGLNQTINQTRQKTTDEISFSKKTTNT